MAKKKINTRYIDANLVKDALLGWETEPTDEEIEYAIDNIPTADVVEVKHGEWIETGDRKLDVIYSGQKCSVCGYVYCGDKTNYCPCCGAKMDER